MSQGQRPGGLTALAVLNFIFGGFRGMGIIGTTMLLVAPEKVHVDPADIPPRGFLVYTLIAVIVSASLLITCGMGFLRTRRWARWLSSAWAAFSLIDTGINIHMAKQGFSLPDVIYFVYPLIILVVVNTTFQEDFVD